MGNGNVLKSCFKGTAHPAIGIQARDTLFVPGLCRRLVSVCQLAKDYNLLFDEDGCIIKDPVTYKSLYNIKSVGNLCELPGNNECAQYCQHAVFTHDDFYPLMHMPHIDQLQHECFSISHNIDSTNTDNAPCMHIIGNNPGNLPEITNSAFMPPFNTLQSHKIEPFLFHHTNQFDPLSGQCDGSQANSVEQASSILSEQEPTSSSTVSEQSYSTPLMEGAFPVIEGMQYILNTVGMFPENKPGVSQFKHALHTSVPKEIASIPHSLTPSSVTHTQLDHILEYTHAVNELHDKTKIGLPHGSSD